MKVVNSFGTDILSAIPIFSGLSKEESATVEAKFRIAAYPKGTLIYRKGDCRDAFYCVLSGRVAVYLPDDQGHNRVLEYLHRGQYFGIISLLTGDPHSVTAEAVNDSRLLVINKDDFDVLLKTIPQLGLDLSRTLCRRLKSRDKPNKTVFETEIISVLGLSPRSGKTVYTANLSFSLHKETAKKVIVIELRHKNKLHAMPRILNDDQKYRELDLSLQQQVKEGGLQDFIIQGREGLDFLCLDYSEPDEGGDGFMEIISRLFSAYHYLILDLPPFTDKFVMNLLKQSQVLHLVSGSLPGELRRSRRLLERLERDNIFNRENIRVIINDYDPLRLHPQDRSVLLGREVFANLPLIRPACAGLESENNPGHEYSRALRRIARQTGGCTVGLALGVGFAYGLCHLGVLKVLEEEKIPIDIISGSSMGGLIASLWVSGKSSEEILEIAAEFKDYTCTWKLIDLTFPFAGFIKGNKLYRFLKRHLGDKTFRDVKLPLKIIASDIRRKESRVLDSGSLVDAIMTSCSMPGIFRPFMSKGDLLLDGGIAHPLPVEALIKGGARKIIAVNVTPSKELFAEGLENAQGSLSAERAKRSAFNRFMKDRLRYNILELVFSSVEFMQSELARKEAALADVVMNPDTRGLFWLDIHRAREFSERGEKETRKYLQRIKELL